MAQNEDTSRFLDDKVIKGVQGIVGALLYVGIAVDNKPLVAFSAIGYQQTAATVETAEEIEQPLDYVATYPENGIIF